MNNKIFRLASIVSILIILFAGNAVDGYGQKRRPKRPAVKKKIQSATPSTAATPTPTPLSPTSGAKTNGTNRAELVKVEKPRENNPYDSINFDVPFLEICPKTFGSAEKKICVGIGRGDDKATPDDVAYVHNTISRIFFGKRFVMVRLAAEANVNQRDEAKDKGCDYFVQTKYKSPFKGGTDNGVWAMVAGLTQSALPKLVKDVSVLSDTTKTNTKGKEVKMTEAEKQADGKKKESFTESAGKVAGNVIGFLPGGAKRYEVAFDLYSVDGPLKPIGSNKWESDKIKGETTEREAANTLYNLLRSSTELMLQAFDNPTQASKILKVKKKD